MFALVRSFYGKRNEGNFIGRNALVQMTLNVA
jgi:hypothetical protein